MAASPRFKTMTEQASAGLQILGGEIIASDSASQDQHHRILSLSSAEDVARAARSIGFFNRPRVDEIRISESIEPQVRQSIGKKISWALRDCGCVPASVSLLGVILFLFFYGGFDWSNALWTSLGTVFAAAFFAALLTKYIALAASWLWLRWLLKNLAARLHTLETLEPNMHGALNP